MKKHNTNHGLSRAKGTACRAPTMNWLWLSLGAVAVLLALPLEAWARVGGGGSYSGGGHGGSGGGGGGAIIGVVRILVWLTIEYPAVGIPVDVVVVGFV